MGKNVFRLAHRRLVITDGGTGDLLWTGEPLDAPVEQVEQVPSASTAIVRLDHMAVEGTFRNLICVDQQGRVAWQAELPRTESASDAYVHVGAVTPETIEAHSWSGYVVTLDTGTGRLLAQTFTK